MSVHKCYAVMTDESEPPIIASVDTGSSINFNEEEQFYDASGEYLVTIIGDGDNAKLEGNLPTSLENKENKEEAKGDIISLANGLEDMNIVDMTEEADFYMIYDVDDKNLLEPPEAEFDFSPRKLPWRAVLTGTGLWFPKSLTMTLSGKVMVAGIQVLLTTLLFLYFLVETGSLSRDWKSNIVINRKFPFTVAHTVIWELRWVLTYIIGVMYGHSRHLDKFVANLKLPRSIMRRASILQVLYLLLLMIVVIILPSFLHGFELYEWGNVGYWNPFFDTMLFILYRLITIPSFCLVTYLLYLNGCAILALGSRLYRTDARQGISSAKRQILITKRIISDTETGVQLYLIVHFILILSAAFTGLFSCFERLEFKPNPSNRTLVTHNGMQLDPQLKMRMLELQRSIPALTPELSIANNSILQLVNENGLDANNMALVQLYRYHNAMVETSRLIVDAMKALEKNRTTMSIVKERKSSLVITEFISSSGVILETTCSLCEVLVLYLVPIFLILWQNKCLREVRNNVIGLDTDVQTEGGYLFVSEDLKDELIKYIQIVQPVRVWGYEISVYKAMLVTCLAPFVTLTLHTIVKHIGKDLYY